MMAVPKKLNKVVSKPIGERVVRFLREVRSELRKVAWPNRKELTTYTIVVLASVAITSIFLGLVDLVISEFLTELGRLVGR